MVDTKTLIICSLVVDCGYDDVGMLGDLAASKQGYLEQAMRRIVEEEGMVPSLNNLLQIGAEIAYADITGREPCEELSLYMNGQDSHVYLLVKHLDFQEVSEKFLDATGLELEEYSTCEDGADITLFQKFKDYLLDEVAPDLEVVDDGKDLVVSDIEKDFLLFLQRQFDIFSEGVNVESDVLEQVVDYIDGGELDDYSKDSLWETLYLKAIEGYKEGNETKETEDELNRTYR